MTFLEIEVAILGIAALILKSYQLFGRAGNRKIYK